MKPGRTDSFETGGTANLAVRGGNLPPRSSLGLGPLWGDSSPRRSVGRVAQPNGQVARSTHCPTASFRHGAIQPRHHAGFSLVEVMIAVGIFFMAVFTILALVTSSLRGARQLQTQRVTAATAAPQLYYELTRTNQMPDGFGTVDMGDLYPDYEWTYDCHEAQTNGWYRVDLIVQARHGDPVKGSMTFYVFNPNSASARNARGFR